jgi:hypothetical protein
VHGYQSTEARLLAIHTKCEQLQQMSCAPLAVLSRSSAATNLLSGDRGDQDGLLLHVHGLWCNRMLNKVAAAALPAHICCASVGLRCCCSSWSYLPGPAAGESRRHWQHAAGLMNCCCSGADKLTVVPTPVSVLQRKHSAEMDTKVG